MPVIAKTLICTGCGEVARWLESDRHKQKPPDGWKRDAPVRCAKCLNKISQSKEKRTMATPVPSNARALREMYNLLESYFDGEKGTYKAEYSDERVAKETGLAEGFVKSCRVDAYGKLQPPSELDTAVRDLRELETLFLKFETETKEKIKDLTARIRLLQKRFD